MAKIIENNSIVPIEKVKPNSYNPKKSYKDEPELEAIFEKIKKSIQVHGQIDPILVRELEDGSFEIVNGFHRYEAMKELGWTEIEIKNLGKISRAEAIAKALSTEDIKVPLDRLEVATLVKELSNIEGFNLEKLPYTLEEIDSQIEMIDFDWEKELDREGGEGTDEEDDAIILKFIGTEEERQKVAQVVQKVMADKECDRNRVLLHLAETYAGIE